MSVLENFCGEKFHIFDKDKKCFEKCFQELVFCFVPFTLQAMFNSYYIGRLQIPDVKIKICNQIKTCLYASIFTLILIVVNFFITYHFVENLQPVVFLSFAIQSLSVLIHCLYLKRLSNVHFLYKFGPFYAVSSWLICFIYFVFDCEYSISNLIFELQNGNPSTAVKTNAASSILIISCQVAYLISLASGNRKYRTVSLVSAPQPETDIGDAEHELLLTSDTYSEVAGDLKDEECPVDNANIISRLVFYWVRPLMQKGSYKTLNKAEDTFTLPSDLDTKYVAGLFLEKLKELYDKSNVFINITPKSNIFLGAFNHCYGLTFYLLGILKLLSTVLGFAGPLLLNRLVSFIEEPQTDFSSGYWFAFGLMLSTLLNSFVSTHFDYQVNKIKIKFRTSLLTAVYDKTLHAQPTDFSTYSIGEVTNFMSTDVDRVVNFCPSFHAFLSLAVEVSLALYLMYEQINLVFLAGLGLAIIMIIFNRYLAVKIGKYNQDMMKHKDERVKIMQELLLGIRVIKFNAWEGRISEKIKQYRDQELKSLKGIKYLDALCVYLWATTPVMISLLTFSVYSTLGYKLTAAKVFTVIALINMLIAPLNAFPWVVNGLMEAWVSIKRLNKFICMPNFNWEYYYSNGFPESGSVLRVKDGFFTWTSSTNFTEDYRNRDTSNQLYDIDLDIKQGQLVGVVGTVGSGKSSLLLSIIARMRKITGEISLCHDDVAYVAQEPWVQNMTVRENIIWGEEYNAHRYNIVVDACGLQEDFRTLVRGDNTEVGENGVTLSGGQKARISLARAVYKDKQLYLLDDPLSAVDQHVATHLYEHCIQGILANKTRILCTHHTKFLRHADKVIAMKNGKIDKIGTPNEVLPELFNNEENTTMKKLKTVKKKSLDASAPTHDGQELGTASLLMTTEEKMSGTVATAVYSAYWRAIGTMLSIFIMIFLILMQASKVTSDWWLSYWISHDIENQTLSTSRQQSIKSTLHISPVQYTILMNNYTGFSNAHDINTHEHVHDTRWYLMVYGCITAANTIFTLFRAFTFAYGGIQAAKLLHKLLLNSVLQAPVSFFQSTPIGRIVNRFSSDMYSIDDSLPFILNIFLAQLVGVIATVVVTCYGFPWFIVALLPLSAFYYYIQAEPKQPKHYYRLTSREVKRLNTISLSPIYANFNETILGLDTIAAFNKRMEFCAHNQQLINMNQRCVFSSLAAQEWFAIRLKMIGVVMVSAVAFLTVIMHQHNAISPGIAGLALSYALSVTDRLSGVITAFTETEKQMVAVERQSYYIKNIPKEEIIEEYDIPHVWPSIGSISFRGVSLQYKKGHPYAIDNLSVEIGDGEKIGIVGRTGSGKSSIFAVLFNMVRPTHGSISIDGLYTTNIPLHILRSKMSIIPQDPFLFSGTVRDNLNPRESYTDTEMWVALERSGLSQKIVDMGGLDAIVGERGKLFSVGQRQLLCLARAMLSKSKIICLDEATGNIDFASDQLIQKSIRSCFRGCTILTIAHRIETIMDSDKILVMDAARMVEFGPVDELLKDDTSHFYKLAHSGRIIH